MVCRQPENRPEGDTPIVAAVVAKDELVEAGVDVLTAKAVTGPKAPALQEREYPMNHLKEMCAAIKSFFVPYRPASCWNRVCNGEE